MMKKIVVEGLLSFSDWTVGAGFAPFPTAFKKMF